MTFEALQAPVVGHYEQRLRQYGPTARGMDWKDEASQRLRFEVLTGLTDLQGRSVYDVGAGAGHLYDYLRDVGIGVDYVGSDRSLDMVRAARARLPGVRFEERDILAVPPSRRFDVVLCSGVFHVKLDAVRAAWKDFVFAMIGRMYDLCEIGISFNLMSRRVDFETDRLFYADPGEILDHCLRALSRRVVLRHDYPLYEFTTYVYREGRG